MSNSYDRPQTSTTKAAIPIAGGRWTPKRFVPRSLAVAMVSCLLYPAFASTGEPVGDHCRSSGGPTDSPIDGTEPNRGYKSDGCIPLMAALPDQVVVAARGNDSETRRRRCYV